MELDVAHAEIGEIEFGDTDGIERGCEGVGVVVKSDDGGAEMKGEEGGEGWIGVVEGAVAEDLGWGSRGRGHIGGAHIGGAQPVGLVRVVVHIGGAQPVGLVRVVVHIGGIKIRAESVDGGKVGHDKKSSCQIFGRKKMSKVRFGNFPVPHFAHISFFVAFFRRVFSSIFFVAFLSPFLSHLVTGIHLNTRATGRLTSSL
jgi:hypothetical protein